MAKMPSALDKREYVFGTRGTAEDCRRIGGACLERDWTADAVALFARAGDEDRLGELLEQAIEEGDAFLAERAAIGLGRELDETQLRRLGDRALSLGKHRFAAMAFEKLNDESALRLATEKGEADHAALELADGKARAALLAWQGEQDGEEDED